MRALILGLGISGRAAAEFLLMRGYTVTAVEKKTQTLSHPDLLRLREKGLVALSENVQIDMGQFDLLVPSPGVPQSHPLYSKAEQNGIKIVGEAELALQSMRQPAVAITGTNGKTTVTLLVEHILRNAGKKARALGNVGEPLSTYFIQPDPKEIIVAELSSYQLETMATPVFDAGVILNITPDHLDRYPHMLAYAEAKCRLQLSLKAGAPLFVHEKIAAEFGSLLTRKELYTYGVSSRSHFWTDRRKIYDGEGVEYLLPARYRELGEHESENILAAWLLVRPFGVKFASFIEGVESFCKPPHRIEFVRMVDEVAYIDDSKGTNLDATIQAVKAMPGPVILIAGGVDKGSPYAPWIPVFQGRVKRIIVLGQAAAKMMRELEGAFVIEMVDSLREAVQQARKEAVKGDCVLLSPGCSSYDMFRDYAHRGEEFKRCVNDLIKREE